MAGALGVLGASAGVRFAGGLATLVSRSATALADGQQRLPFVDEGSLWRAESLAATGDGGEPARWGSGLGGRQLFDLATVRSGTVVVPSDRFFVRTFEPANLPDPSAWRLEVLAPGRQPRVWPIAEIRRRARRRGIHLIECSGNGREYEFGLIGVASWDGVPALELLGAGNARAGGEAADGAEAVEIEGFDEHRMPSLGSVEGASWIFTREQLERSGAFFATGMNGQALPPDHGHPLRLVVPGWYGCVSIKWVRRARWVDPGVPATSQMREFAERTHQDGVPERALDYAPATVDPIALPVRAALAPSRGGREIRLTGVLWGGPAIVRRLEIRCGEDARWERVQELERARRGTPWRVWTLAFRHTTSGRHPIRLRVAEPRVRTLRLDRDDSTRILEIPEA